MKKKELNPEVKANVVSGMSSAVGSAAGVVTGSMIGAQKADAAEAEVVALEDDDDSVEAEVVATETVTTSAATVNNGTTGGSQEVVSVVDEEEPEDDVDVNVISTEPGEAEVVVIDHPVETNVESPRVTHFETMTLENGQQVDMAAIDVEGQTLCIADLNQDGVADIAFTDLNGNDEIEENEIEDISGQGVDMQSLHDAVNTEEGLTAQVTETDYVNDANVDLYYA